MTVEPSPLPPNELLGMAKALLLGAAAVWAFYGATLITILREVVFKTPPPLLPVPARWGATLGVVAFLGINGWALYLLQFQGVALIKKALPDVPVIAGHEWLLVGHAAMDVGILIAVIFALNRKADGGS